MSFDTTGMRLITCRSIDLENVRESTRSKYLRTAQRKHALVLRIRDKQRRNRQPPSRVEEVLVKENRQEQRVRLRRLQHREAVLREIHRITHLRKAQPQVLADIQIRLRRCQRLALLKVIHHLIAVRVHANIHRAAAFLDEHRVRALQMRRVLRRELRIAAHELR